VSPAAGGSRLVSVPPLPLPVEAPLGIEVAGLSKGFGRVPALDGVSMTVPLGGITALVGRNGAGKSTLIRILATAVRPDGGRASVCGHDVADDDAAVRRHIGLTLGEDRSFFWRLSGWQNLEFFGRLYGVRGRVLRQRVAHVIESVELTPVADRRVDRYSTGMRSRLGLARALLGDPTVLLLDEPTRSLDPAAASSVRVLLRRLLAGGGRCALLATHDLGEAVALADQIVVLRSGTAVACHRPPFDPEQIAAVIRGGP
jgi:ABC-type multidrug transport system ATPase subunit